MDATSTKFRTVDEYLAGFPPSTKKMMQELRTAIKQAAPEAEEVISYNMPAYKLKGVLVYFAGYKGHIGFYPLPSAIEAFKKELAAYEQSKGTVRFPLDEPLPVKIVTKLVKFRVKENLEKDDLKSKKKK